MKPWIYWAGALSALSALVTGCTSGFASCEAKKGCAAKGGSDAGDAGATGGAGASGGAPTAESGGASASDGGVPALVARLNDPCNEAGAIACAGPTQKLLLLCDGTTWVLGTSCRADENCDTSDPSCGKIAPECVGRAPGDEVCDGDELVTCGPDLVTTSREACEGLCQDGACQTPRCGDGRTQASLGETCDDGNDVDTDDCPSTCQTPTCGDGFVWEGHEPCDDGNDVDTDDCLSTCQTPTCGDGFAWEGHEPCDDGNDVDTDDCVTGCIAPRCGDGFVWEGQEQCEPSTSPEDCRTSCQWIWDPIGGSCALQRVSGVAKCWGLNSQVNGTTERLGDQPGEMGAALPPVDFGGPPVAMLSASDHVCAVLEGGTLSCLGDNQYGQLGVGNADNIGDSSDEIGAGAPRVDLGTGRTVLAAVAGLASSCAILNGQQLKCWGANDLGQLGVGDTEDRGDQPGEMGDNLPFVDLGTGRTPTSLALGGSHTCALLDNDQIKCWGSGIAGAIGAPAILGDEPGEMGDNLPFVDLGTSRSAHAVTAGSNFTCAVLDDGRVKCWGHNPVGELGLGDTNERGNNLGDMGDNLPFVDLGTGETAVAITAGDAHACALLARGAVKCWGHNQYGQLGIGSTEVGVGDEPGEMGDNLPAVDLGGPVVSVAAFRWSTCALLVDGSIRCWGANQGGQLGIGDTQNRGSSPSDMGGSLPPVQLD